MKKKIVTHDNGFHADDIFAVATLLLLHPDAEVLRSRDKDVHAVSDYVVDTGMVYDPSKNRFDHHMPGGAGERDNGIPYAAFGLVWKEFGERLAGGQREAEIIDIKLAQALDALDNGVAVSDPFFKGVREYSVIDFLYSHLSSSDNTPEKIYEVFIKCVGIAKDLLVREIIKAKESAEGEKVMIKIYEEAIDKRLIELPENSSLPWIEVLTRFPEPLYAIYLQKDGNWGIKAVPDTSKPYGHQRKPLPQEWAGKEGHELEVASGVEGAVFAHNKRFMAVAKSREAVLKLADLALKA